MLPSPDLLIKNSTHLTFIAFRQLPIPQKPFNFASCKEGSMLYISRHMSKQFHVLVVFTFLIEDCESHVRKDTWVRTSSKWDEIPTPRAFHSCYFRIVC